MTNATKASDPLDLFPDLKDIAAGTQLPVEHVEIKRIVVDPDNPRTDADDSLVHLIRKHGVEPITVTPIPEAERGLSDGADLMILGGERRYWGAIKAGLSTIPVKIDRTPMTPVQRIVRAAALNAHRDLSALDEARMYERVQNETGWSEQQIAEVFHTKKSTVADRLALVKAPPAFRAHFESGLLSAAAAPIVRKFFGVPENILEMAARTAPADLAWDQARRAGKPVELKDVGRVLDRIILEERMRELPEHLVLLYQGPRCKVAGVEYAVDVPLFLDADRKHEAEKRRAEVEKAKPLAVRGAAKPLSERSFHERDAIKTVGGLGALGGEEDDDESDGSVGVAPRTPAAPKQAAAAPAVSAAERKREQQAEKERQDAERRRKAWDSGKILIAHDIARELKKAPARGQSMIATFLLEIIAQVTRIDVARTAKIYKIPRYGTAEEFMRFAVMAILDADIEEDFNVEGLPRRIRELGLKVDVAKILEGQAKHLDSVKKEKAAKAAPKPAKKVMHRGRVLVPVKKSAKKKSGKR